MRCPAECVLTPYSLPIFLARIISLLGLSQTVMTYALALAGLPIPAEDAESSSEVQALLPVPLASCRCDRIRDSMGLLALVIVACKHLPEWEKYGFKESNLGAKSTGPLFPWNESEHMLSNGNLESYLCRAGAIFISSEETAASTFLRKLNSRPMRRKKSQTEFAVRMTPSRSFQTCEKFLPRTEAFLHCEREDLNPAFRKSIGFCPLIDFVARKAGVNPIAIAGVVAEMESETRLRHFQNDLENTDYSLQRAFQRRCKLTKKS